jgi:hypothetical protein
MENQQFSAINNTIPMGPPLPESTNRREKRISGRSKASKWNWDQNQDNIKRLYMEQMKSLDETMEIMRKDFQFSPS